MRVRGAGADARRVFTRYRLTRGFTSPCLTSPTPALTPPPDSLSHHHQMGATQVGVMLQRELAIGFLAPCQWRRFWQSQQRKRLVIGSRGEHLCRLLPGLSRRSFLVLSIAFQPAWAEISAHAAVNRFWSLASSDDGSTIIRT